MKRLTKTITKKKKMEESPVSTKTPTNKRKAEEDNGRGCEVKKTKATFVPASATKNLKRTTPARGTRTTMASEKEKEKGPDSWPGVE